MSGNSALTPRQRQLLLLYLRRSPGVFWGLFGLSLLIAVLEACSVFTILPLAASLSGAAGPLSRWCLIIAVLVVARAVVILAHARLSARTSAAAIHEAKTSVLRAYASASDAAFLEIEGGLLGQICLGGSYSVGIIILRLPQLAAEAARAAALALLLLWLNFWVAVGVVLAGAALWEIFRRALSPRAYAEGHDRFATETRQSILLGEILRGARQVRMAGGMGSWLERFAQTSSACSRYYAAEMTLQALSKVWFELGTMAVILGWMLAAMWQGSGRETSFMPILATAVVGTGKLMPCLAALGRHRLEILGSLPSAEALEDFLERHPRTVCSVGRRYEGSRPGLRLENVSFTYPGRTEILKGVDLDIASGRCVVITGPYGCGKTTLLGLLLGLLEPSAGKVLLDGRPLQDYDRTSWWKRVGIVPQDDFLFHGTVAENILLGRTGYARKDVERAAGLVDVHAFIASLPQGYETVMGEEGLKLSGGQRQLVILARALLSAPQVLVLDEPATGLDPRSQAQLARVLRSASTDRTVVVATHQPDWAAWADASFLLQDGKLGAVNAHGMLPVVQPKAGGGQAAFA